MAPWLHIAGHASDMLVVACAAAIVVVAIMAVLILEIARRAIEKSPPDNIPLVISALGELVSSFRWVWPQPRDDWQTLGKSAGRGQVLTADRQNADEEDRNDGR